MNIFSPGSLFCADSYFDVRSAPGLEHRHENDSGYSARSAGGRLWLKTHIHPMWLPGH